MHGKRPPLTNNHLISNEHSMAHGMQYLVARREPRLSALTVSHENDGMMINKEKTRPMTATGEHHDP